jgi:hypothetical protein
MLKDSPDYDDVIKACVPMFHDAEIWDAIKVHITDPSASARQATTGEMRRSDGSLLTYITNPLPDGNTLTAFADVTATRRVESALRDRAEAFEAADRLKTEFVRNVSYQLRSPADDHLRLRRIAGDPAQRRPDRAPGRSRAGDPVRVRPSQQADREHPRSGLD